MENAKSVNGLIVGPWVAAEYVLYTLVRRYNCTVLLVEPVFFICTRESHHWAETRCATGHHVAAQRTTAFVDVQKLPLTILDSSCATLAVLDGLKCC